MKNELKKLWFKTKSKFKEWRCDDPLMIAPYLSYANKQDIIIRGRVLENEDIVVKEDDGKWENFVNSLKRMESDEASHVNVKIEYDGKEYLCKTNEEGFFKITIPREQRINPSEKINWLEAKLSLANEVNHQDKPICASIKIAVLGVKTKYALVTDMDDTILKSHVNSFLKLRLLYETFLKNVHTRSAFENIGPVLKKITHNKNGQQINPIFYLSHSPWNLYELLLEFLSKNKIPKGPFFLRDFGYKRGREKFEYDNHKALAIEHLMNFYPDLPFLLIGDATEHDVDIYTKAFKKFPDRILIIMIRATEKESKNQHVRDMKAANPKAPIFLIHHSDEILELTRDLL